MRLFHFILLAFILNSGSSFGQLPSSAKKLEGAWMYKEGSGYEVWKIKDDKLVGYTYRVTKLGDTSKVEDMVLAKFNNTLVYNVTSYNIVNDSLITSRHMFIGRKRKMFFLNQSENAPYSVEYKLGFFNRNKLKVLVQNTISDDAIKYTLYRIKE